jgi:hypothetical protein
MVSQAEASAHNLEELAAGLSGMVSSFTIDNSSQPGTLNGPVRLLSTG